MHAAQIGKHALFFDKTYLPNTDPAGEKNAGEKILTAKLHYFNCHVSPATAWPYN